MLRGHSPGSGGYREDWVSALIVDACGHSLGREGRRQREPKRQSEILTHREGARERERPRKRECDRESHKSTYTDFSLPSLYSLFFFPSSQQLGLTGSLNSKSLVGWMLVFASAGYPLPPLLPIPSLFSHTPHFKRRAPPPLTRRTWSRKVAAFLLRRLSRSLSLGKSDISVKKISK